MAAATQSMTFEQLSAYLQGLGERLQSISFRRPLQTVALYLASQARRCFDESRAPDGSPWAPLVAPSARRGGASAKPLRDTGLLMASLTGQGAGHVEQISDVAILWGTNVAYGSHHQYGTRRIPARPFLGLTPSMESRISLIVTDYVERLLKGAA